MRRIMGKHTSVESGIRADVDEREQNRDGTGNGYGVGGNLQLGVYLADPVAEWQSPISGKCPGLTRCRQVEGHSTGKDEDCGNSVEGYHTAGGYGLGKDPHMGIVALKRSFDICNHEHVADEEDYAKRAIHKVSADHCAWDSLASIFDLLGHMGCRVRACDRSLVQSQ